MIDQLGLPRPARCPVVFVLCSCCVRAVSVLCPCAVSVCCVRVLLGARCPAVSCGGIVFPPRTQVFTRDNKDAFYTRSADAGVHWDRPTNITAMLFGGDRTAFCGTGHAAGLVLPGTGELLVPMYNAFDIHFQPLFGSSPPVPSRSLRQHQPTRESA